MCLNVYFSNPIIKRKYNNGYVFITALYSVFIVVYFNSLYLFINTFYTKLQKKYKEIKALVNRCIECNATVITPIILTDQYSRSKIQEISSILGEFQNIYNLPLEYIYTEVSFIVNGEKVQTIIIRQSFGKNTKFNDNIKIYYDPYNPKQAFAKDMKGILLHKPLRDCIIYGIVAVICLLSAVFIKYLDLSVIL